MVAGRGPPHEKKRRGRDPEHRIYLRKAGAERKAIMIDSPMHPYGDTNFMVVEAGITDPMDKKPTKVFKSPSKHQEKERDDEEE